MTQPITDNEIERLLNEVRAERFRQNEKWGIQNHSPETWLLVLGEEVGEVCRALLESRFGKQPLSEYRAELIHVVAVAVAAAESFDRNEGGVK